MANMRSPGAHPLRVITAIAGVIGMHVAVAKELQISNVEPGHVMREAATFEIAIFGSGFNTGTAVRFHPTGTEKHGGISVKQVNLVDPRRLVAIVEVDSAVAAGYFDVEISGDQGERVRGKSLLLVEPTSWAGRFGCTGAEVWRKRIPCKRGKVD